MRVQPAACWAGSSAATTSSGDRAARRDPRLCQALERFEEWIAAAEDCSQSWMTRSKLVGVGGLGEVVVEAGVARPVAVGGLAVAGQRDQQRRARLAHLAQAPARPRSRPCTGRPMSSRTTSGANTGADASASLPSPTALTSWPASSSSTAVASAASWLSSTTRMRQPGRGRRPGRVAPTAPDRRRPRPGRAARPGTREPCPDPALVASTVPVVQLDQALHERQADAEAALAAVERALALLEQLEDVAAAARRRCRCRCRARVITACRLGVDRQRELDRAALLGVLGGVVEQVGDDLRQAREVAAQHRPARRERARELVATRFEERLRGLDACATTARRSSGSRLQRDLALVDARDVEQVLDQPRQVARPAGR